MNVSLLHSCDTIFVLEKVSTLNPVSTKQANYIYIYIYTHTHTLPYLDIHLQNIIEDLFKKFYVSSGTIISLFVY